MTWIRNNYEIILQAFTSHLWLAIPAIIATLIISVPVAKLAITHPRIREVTLTSTGLLYAIPSLPLFIFIPLIFGIPLRSPTNVHIVLTVYGCALMVRATADALGSVNADLLDAATASGYSNTRRFFMVQLPLAGPAILAGLRVVAVSTISLTTVSAVLGIKSLGTLFTDGFQRGIVIEVLAGIILTTLLAFVIDALLVVLGRIIMPFQKHLTAEGKK